MASSPDVLHDAAGSAHPLATPFVAGLAVGRALQTIALEGYAHTSLAHNNLKYRPLAARAAHNTLLLLGMMPNEFAAHHRLHHATDTIPPVEGLTERVKSVLISGSVTDQTDVDLDDPRLRFPGMSYDDDPLLLHSGQEVTFQFVPPLERVIKKGGVYRAAGVFMLAGAAGLIGRAVSSERPLKRTAAFLGGIFAGVTANSVITAYKENSAGVINGQVNLESANGITRTKLRRHARHHADPANLETGLNTTDRLGIQLLTKLGVVRRP